MSKGKNKGIKLELWVDGAAEPNPGSMGVGVVAKIKGEVIREVSEEAGEGTNNEAEYKAVIRGLEEARILIDEGVRYDFIVVKSDSQLIVEQMAGRYAVRQGHLGRLKEKARRTAKSTGRNVYYTWVRRHYNQRANDLAEKAAMGVEAWRRKKLVGEVVKLAAKGIEIVPLSVFRRKSGGWNKLTISEALVYELVKNRGLSTAQVSRELGRKYTTIHTTLMRAKKKVTI